MKNQKYKKSLTNGNKILYFYFCIWKKIYFARKYSLVKFNI